MCQPHEIAMLLSCLGWQRLMPLSLTLPWEFCCNQICLGGPRMLIFLDLLVMCATGWACLTFVWWTYSTIARGNLGWLFEGPQLYDILMPWLLSLLRRLCDCVAGPVGYWFSPFVWMPGLPCCIRCQRRAVLGRSFIVAKTRTLLGMSLPCNRLSCLSWDAWLLHF